MTDFQLDSRLATDTVLIGAYRLCEVRLMNDSRWPWLILVPKLTGTEEIHDLPAADQTQIAIETSLAAAALKSHIKCTKINTAAIGNIVRQLHIHVIARNQGDANWPSPVWGYGERRGYSATDLKETLLKIKNALSVNPEFSRSKI